MTTVFFKGMLADITPAIRTQASNLSILFLFMGQYQSINRLMTTSLQGSLSLCLSDCPNSLQGLQLPFLDVFRHWLVLQRGREREKEREREREREMDDGEREKVIERERDG